MSNYSPFNFGSGKVTFFDFPYDKKHKFGIEDHLLRENLIQVEYKGEVILDVGWYGESYEDKNGHFIIQLISGNDWENPIKKEIATCPDELFIKVKSAVRLADRRVVPRP